MAVSGARGRGPLPALSGCRQLLLLLLILLAAGGCRSQECSVKCRSCTNSVADCSGAQLLWGPRPLSPDTLVLNLEGNVFKTLFRRSFQSLPNLEVLRLGGNRIRGVRNFALSVFPALMTLDLSRNRIQRIHKQGLSGLGNLKTLALSNNHLRQVTDIFSNTPALQQVNLAFNRIQQIGRKDFEANTRVHYLNLRNNRLTRVDPRAFSQVRSLRYLFLNNNPLASLPTLVFPANGLLQLLDLNHCRLQSVPRGLPASISDLRLGHNRLSSLTSDDFASLSRLKLAALNDNNISSIAADTFTGMARLGEIWLRGNKLTEIPRGLPATVKKLFIDSNQIHELPAQAFGASSQLEQLTMQGNQLERIHTSALQGLSHLRSASFQGNAIQQLGPGTFSSLPNLTSLILSNNPLQDISPGAFHDLPALKELSLSYVESSGSEGEHVSMDRSLLAAMPALTKLDMMNSPRLVSALMQSLTQQPHLRHPNLQDFDLSYNELTTLPEAVKHTFPGLVRLALDGNPWLCDQNLLWLKHWMTESPVTFSSSDPLTCQEPFNLRGMEITAVPDDRFVEVRIITPAAEPLSNQNAGGQTEELGPLHGQSSQVSENAAGQADTQSTEDQPLLNDQSLLRQVQRSQQGTLSNSASEYQSRRLSPTRDATQEETFGLTHNSAKTSTRNVESDARIDAGNVPTRKEKDTPHIPQGRANEERNAPMKTARKPDTSQRNEMKQHAEGTASNRASAIMRPSQDEETERRPPSTQGGSEVSERENNTGKEVREEEKTALQNMAHRANTGKQNAVKKPGSRSPKRRRRLRKGKGKKRTRKTKNRKGKKNKRRRRRRRRRHHGKKRQRKNRGQKAATPVTTPPGIGVGSSMKSKLASA